MEDLESGTAKVFSFSRLGGASWRRTSEYGEGAFEGAEEGFLEGEMGLGLGLG